MKPVPYPPEIKARGWSFDLDVERIEASDSWALAGNELQPWLLKTWYVAWKSQPVGSMPADPRLFAARIGMPWGQFQDAAEVLMRGWSEHADGLLYHPTITEKVNEMIDRRVKDRIKTQKYRERLMPKDHEGEPDVSPGTDHTVTSDTLGTTRDVTGEKQVSSTPTPTPTPTPSPTEREQDKPATRSNGKQMTFAKWAEAERSEGRSLIADWKPLAAYQASTGLPNELAQMAWIAFKDRYTNSTNYRAKKYTDWRDVFLNAIKGNWLGLWFIRDDVYELTTVGKQAERAQAAEVTE